MLVVETPLGQALTRRLRERGLRWGMLEGLLGFEAPELELVLTEQGHLTTTVAGALARVLGESPDYWLRLDDDEDDAPSRSWLRALDSYGADSLKALRSRGVLAATRRQPEQLARELREFFDCRPDEVEALVPASYRQSQAYPVARDAVSVWLRLADKQARRLADFHSVPALDLEGLRRLLPQLVRVGRKEPRQYLDEVRERLADVGVVLVFQQDVPGTRLSGASWPSSLGYGVVALTLRHRKDDFFWWTLFHECAHLLLQHGRVLDSLVDDLGEVEEAANRLAQSLLLPAGWDGPLTKVSHDRVSALASKLDVPAGVLVGQLQKARGLKPNWLAALKKRMPDPEGLEVLGLDRPDGPAWAAALEELRLQGTLAP